MYIGTCITWYKWLKLKSFSWYNLHNERSYQLRLNIFCHFHLKSIRDCWLNCKSHKNLSLTLSHTCKNLTTDNPNLSLRIIWKCAKPSVGYYCMLYQCTSLHMIHVRWLSVGATNLYFIFISKIAEYWDNCNNKLDHIMPIISWSSS